MTKRRTTFFLGLAILGVSGSAEAQGAPPAPPSLAPVPPPVAPNPQGAAPPPGLPLQGMPPPRMPPQGYYPPPSFYGPSRLAWKEGEVIPAGYSLESRPRRQVLNAGVSTFAPLYGLSILFASVYAGNEDRSSGYYLPMYVPVLGPFITLGSANTDGFEVLTLLLDGVGQATGAAMILAGALGEEKFLLRKEAGFDLRPEVFVGPRSAAFRWKF